MLHSLCYLPVCVSDACISDLMIFSCESLAQSSTALVHFLEGNFRDAAPACVSTVTQDVDQLHLRSFPAAVRRPPSTTMHCGPGDNFSTINSPAILFEGSCSSSQLICTNVVNVTRCSNMPAHICTGYLSVLVSQTCAMLRQLVTLIAALGDGLHVHTSAVPEILWLQVHT